MASALRKYLKVALLGAIVFALLTTMVTGVVLDIVLVGAAISLGFIFLRL